MILRCCVRGLLLGEGVGWVHRIRADLTYVDLDVPPDYAVTVTGAVGGPRCEEVAARVPRCAGGERLHFFVEESRPSILFFNRE
jgi:hypothetical protein